MKKEIIIILFILGMPKESSPGNQKRKEILFIYLIYCCE